MTTSNDSLNAPKSTSQDGAGGQNQHAGSSNAGNTPFPTSAQPEAPSDDASTGDAATQAAGRVHAAIDAAAESGEDFTRRLVKGAHAAIDKLADVATPAVERIKGSYGEAADKLSDVAGQASDMKDRWVADVRDIVRENPLAAIAAAIAVGAIYVKLTSTSRRTRRDREDE